MEDPRVQKRVEHILATIALQRKTLAETVVLTEQEIAIATRTDIKSSEDNIALFSKTYDQMLALIFKLAKLIPQRDHKIVNTAEELHKLSLNLLKNGKFLVSNKRKGFIGNSDLDTLTVKAVGFEIQMKRIASLAKSNEHTMIVKKLKLDKGEEINKLSDNSLSQKAIIEVEVDKINEMLHLCQLALEKLYGIRDLCLVKK